MSQAIRTLKTLVGVYGPSGNERKVGECIEAMLRDYADDLYYDKMGNLVAVKRGGEKKILCAAHMDQNGFMVTYIDENGFLRITPVGGMNAVTFINAVVMFENGVQGIISFESNGEPLEKVTFDRLYVDIGATNAEKAEKLVNIGDICVCVAPILENEKHFTSAALDDRIGCAVLVEAFKRCKDSPNEIYAVFTVQEEVGCRGASTAAYDIRPDIAIALDVTLSCDTPKAKNVCSCKLGGGPCIKVKDSNLIAHPRVRRLLADAARECNYPFQNEVLAAGGTDAGAISRTAGGVPSGTLSIATRYVHSTVETVDKQDYEHCVDMLACAMYKDF